MVLGTTAVGYYLGSAAPSALLPPLPPLAGTAPAGGRLGRIQRSAGARAVGARRDHVLLADHAYTRDWPPLPPGLCPRGHENPAGARPRRRKYEPSGVQQLSGPTTCWPAADPDRVDRECLSRALDCTCARVSVDCG